MLVHVVINFEIRLINKVLFIVSLPNVQMLTLLKSVFYSLYLLSTQEKKALQRRASELEDEVKVRT